MATKKQSQKGSAKIGKVMKGKELPSNVVKADLKRGKYKFTYTTGPFCLPLKTHSIDWGLSEQRHNRAEGTNHGF